MSDIAIRAQGVSKRYRIGQGLRPHYKTMRDQIAQVFTRLVKRRSQPGLLEGGYASTGDDTIWALRDVSFEIKPGEVVGIIGRNGAGKSTLLKVLTRITEPTLGSVDLYGRVGSLLEVGTGFHKELTGRENIYLNGAILGMRRTEIDRKFDEIVEFSEISKFIDTPVKFYSSGMYVRLAFAVAAHLEPEILLVDEVLSVGDAGFQKKSLNKMEEVGKQGRTVIFVSHHMPSVTRLCERVILMNEGQIIQDGSSEKVVSDYLSSGLGITAERCWNNRDDAPGNDIVCLRAVRIKTADGKITDTIDIRQAVGLEMEYDVLIPNYVLYPHFNIRNEEGISLFVSIDTDPEWRRKPRPTGHYTSITWIPGNLLAEGTVLVGPAIRTEEPHRILHFFERDAVAFHVIESPEGDTARAEYPGRLPGVVRPLLEWETHYSSNGRYP